MCDIVKRQPNFKTQMETTVMNLNYDRIAAIKTALGNMHPSSARDILESFSEACGNLTELIESLQCESCGVRGEPATALQEELTLAEEALNILCESVLPVLLLQQQNASPASNSRHVG